ncbi:MAG: transposase, partial [Parachlamydiaceae bacterium]
MCKETKINIAERYERGAPHEAKGRQACSGMWGIRKSKLCKSRKRRQKNKKCEDKYSMTHSYRLHFFHLVWSTKNRVPYISKDIQERLYSYMAAITRNHSAKLLEIGGMP